MKPLREITHNYGLILEQLHSELQDIVNTSGHNPDSMLRKLTNAHERLKSQGINSGLGSMLGKGSSRVAFMANDQMKIRHKNEKGGIEEKPIHVVHKFAMKHDSSYDSVRGPNEKMLGQLQMINETHPFANDYGFRTWTKSPDGKFYTKNRNGILPTVFHANSDGTHSVTEHVLPFNHEQFNNENGIHFSDAHDSLKSIYKESVDGIPPYRNIPKDILNNQFVNKMKRLMVAGVHPGDMVSENMGHTHDGRTVMLDSGFMNPHSSINGLHNTVAEYHLRQKKKQIADDEAWLRAQKPGR